MAGTGFAKIDILSPCRCSTRSKRPSTPWRRRKAVERSYRESEIVKIGHFASAQRSIIDSFILGFGDYIRSRIGVTVSGTRMRGLQIAGNG